MSHKYVNQMSEEQKQPQAAIQNYINQFSLSESQKQQMLQNIQHRQIRKLRR